MMRYLVLFTLLTLLTKLQAATYVVDDPKTLQKTAHTLQAGDTLVLKDGQWQDIQLALLNDGSAEAPITLTSQTPGGAVLRGATHIAVGGNHVLIDGLHFQHAYTPAAEEGNDSPDALIDFLEKDDIVARDSRITNCYFETCNPAEDRRYHWIRLSGQRNRVDHCRFEGQNHSGVTVQVVLRQPDAEHRIDHNYFLDRKPGQGNGYETIQLGQSWASLERGACIVENNIFESCDGETEVISSKTCDNSIRGNLFLRSAGTLTIRHGNRTTAEGNVFIGGGKTNTGGIRIIGEDHRVVGNYFHGINSYTGGVIVLYTGIPDSPLNGYEAADRAYVANNVILHSIGNAIYLNGGYGCRNRTLLARGTTLKNNIVVHHADFGDVTIAGDLPDARILGNLFNGKELGRPDSTGFTEAKLSLVENADGLFAVKADPTGEILTPELPKLPKRINVGVNWVD